MRDSFIRKICIIIIPALVILTVGAALAAYIEIPAYVGLSVVLAIAVLAAGLWVLACAVAFARPVKLEERKKNNATDAQELAVKIAEAKPDRPSITPRQVAREYGRDLLIRDCRRAIGNASAIADDASPTKAAVSLLREVENYLSDIESYETRLRKAVEMCEDVTNEVYIMSVLANVEVGAHADSIAGFEVIAKQIQPLAESGSMASIEAKASLDAAFAPIGGIRAGIKNVMREISADSERRGRLLSGLADAERAVEKLSDDMGCEAK